MIDSIRLKSNENTSDIATLKLYLFSSIAFLTVALIPSIIF